MTLLAFHNDLAVQQKYLQRVAEHAAADELVQGYGYWKDGMGCAVGCTLHGDCHADYETELGVPGRIAHLEEAIFEGLPADLARTWPVRFLQAIPLGADLSLVWNRFALWLLTDSGMLAITDGNRAAIEGVAELHRRVVEGEQVSERERRSAAESAARSAARSAAYTAMSEKLLELLAAAPVPAKKILS